MSRTIFTGFSPNITKEDVRSASSFFLPWKWGTWNDGDAVSQVESWFRNYFSVPHAQVFDSGRSALHYALKSLGVGEGDEVLVQAYTCVVVSNAIRWTGATPIYVDVDESLNMDPRDLESKISTKSKVLIAQHTFGAPADMDELLSLAKKHNLKVVEDCAHSLGAEYKGKKLGTLGDVAMFSFGSDKIISSARGGIAITNNDEVGTELKKYAQKLAPMSGVHIFQHLMTFPLFFVGRSLYHVGIGKIILALAKKVHLISRIIDTPEKKGQKTEWFPCAYPNALAEIALVQLQQLEEVQRHRIELALFYEKQLAGLFETQAVPHGSAYLRYTIFSPEANKIMKKAKEQGILLGDWYRSVIAPSDADEYTAGYVKGRCPRAESRAARSINLPTNRNVDMADAKKVVDCLKSIHSSLSL